MLEGFDVESEWIAPRMPHLGVIGSAFARGRAEAHRRRRRRAAVLPLPSPTPWRSAASRSSSRARASGARSGFELFLTDPADAAELWNALVEAGVTPFGVEAIEIAADRGRADRDRLRLRGAPADAVRLQPGPARRAGSRRRLRRQGEACGEVAADPPNRFVTLKIEGDALPEYGAAVTKDGEEVGVLTSPTDSPAVRQDRHRGRSERARDAGHRRSTWRSDGGTARATVDVLPIYDTNKQRPRA